ncbi:MAG TPA: STAS domain-containing protein [Limnobacter sp.]|uniref:STAS domain-containing protein n=1 Tax=Limnobacter sp. TaxID=2003368 RepID=UPI002ED8831B
MMTIEEQDDVQVVHLEARVVDAKTAGHIRETLQELMPHHKRFVLDLTATQLVDSGGLAGIVMLLKNMNSQQCRMVLCNLSKPVVTLFQLTKMDRLFKIQPDLKTAIVQCAE